MNIPLPLKIVAIVLLILVILLIIVIKKKKKELIWRVVIVIILVTAFGVWKGLKEYNRTNEDLSTVKADIKISTVDLIHDYEANDSAADQKYLGKVIEINGSIKKIEADEKGYYTVVLGDTTTLSSVRCSMDTVHNKDAALLITGSSAILKGACTGFNKDEMGLGSDVILNRCVIITKKDQ
jgi:energy-coupling factor transporter transmembrane protein EcfT